MKPLLLLSAGLVSIILVACQPTTPTLIVPTNAPVTVPPATLAFTPTSPATPALVVTTRLQDSSVFCPTANEEARQAFNAANTFAENGQNEQAEQAFLKAIELDPQYCDAMDNLGQFLRRQNRLDDAIGWYQKSLAILPTNSVALQNIAFAYRLQGNTQAALDHYQTLTEVAADNPEGYFGLGSVYFESKQPERAIEFLKKADDLYRQNNSSYAVDAEYYLSFSYFLLKDCPKAKSYLEPIYTHFEADRGANYVLGVCYLTAEPIDLKLAKTYVEKAQSLGATIPNDILEAIQTIK